MKTIASANNTEITLAELEALAGAYVKARTVVSERVADLQTEVSALQRRRVGGIKAAAAEAADLCARLRATIEKAPHLFVRPRTMSLHGVTVGFRKGSGKLEWEDDAKTVALIRKHLPDQAELLIITEEKPSADALKNLDAKELAKIGVAMEGTGDFVVVKTTDSALEKLVAKILKEGATAAEAGQ
ncbi:MAG: host-nuclease inhibitor Gam family protein [Verrucomicrobiota bacterium]